MAVGTCESLNVTVDRATAAPIEQLQTKVIDLSFAALDVQISSSTSTDVESPFKQPMKAELGPAPGEQESTV